MTRVYSSALGKEEAWKSLPRPIKKATKRGQIKAYDQAIHVLRMEQQKEIKELEQLEQESD